MSSLKRALLFVLLCALVTWFFRDSFKSPANAGHPAPPIVRPELPHPAKEIATTQPSAPSLPSAHVQTTINPLVASVATDLPVPALRSQLTHRLRPTRVLQSTQSATPDGKQV